MLSGEHWHSHLATRPAGRPWRRAEDEGTEAGVCRALWFRLFQHAYLSLGESGRSLCSPANIFVLKEGWGSTLSQEINTFYKEYFSHDHFSLTLLFTRMFSVGDVTWVTRHLKRFLNRWRASLWACSTWTVDRLFYAPVHHPTKYKRLVSTALSPLRVDRLFDSELFAKGSSVLSWSELFTRGTSVVPVSFLVISTIKIIKHARWRAQQRRWKG